MRSDPADIAVAFARCCAAPGCGVPIECDADASPKRSAASASTQRDSVYWAGRATLVRRPEDIDLFDRAFAVFWERAGRAGGLDEPEPIQRHARHRHRRRRRRRRRRQRRAERRRRRSTLRFSPVGGAAPQGLRRLRRRRAGPGPAADGRLRLVGPPRASLPARATRRRRGRPDLRRTVRAALRAGGEPIRRHWREPGDRLRRLVLLLDVSGSMEPYARAMLRFVHAAVAGRQRVEAFALGTRLTRVTRELDSRDPDVALAAGRRRGSSDWSGGTRLGECLRHVQRRVGRARHGPRRDRRDPQRRVGPRRPGGARRADGSACSGSTHTLIWVNPLKVTPGYAPLARGMAAALPYVDHFVGGSFARRDGRTGRVIAEPVSDEADPDARTARRHRPLASRRAAGGDRPRGRHRGLRPARARRGDGGQRRRRGGRSASAVGASKARSSARRWRSSTASASRGS